MATSVIPGRGYGYHNGVVGVSHYGSIYLDDFLPASTHPEFCIVTSSNYPNGLFGFITYAGGHHYAIVYDLNTMNKIADENVYLVMRYVPDK